ncbi:hypothetical protein LTR53_013771 [Teratosphaeriaceae sp. CCFEE 6253]|nr:hypothetical protein LTR53_013771 [Teratosphaeriaceae sp. CCFEE 6253]
MDSVTDLDFAVNGTPPPSTQRPPSTRAKTRTPTPPVSHISTPPPTIEAPSQPQAARSNRGTMTPDEIAVASAHELRSRVADLQAALDEAKTSAAHHRLQYKMLSQESAAAIERMAVETRMAQNESDIIRISEQSKVAALPVQPALPEGMIPVHRDLYQRMNLDLRQLQDANRQWEREYAVQERLIGRQEGEIASLSDKVTLMRERIRENREHLNKVRGRPSSRPESTPRSAYGTPQRSQGLEALLQASEMTSDRHKRAGGHRTTHSLSSLPATPQRAHKPGPAPVYATPWGRQPPMKVPSTAPMPRTSAMRTPGAADVYARPLLPVPQHHGPQSEGTVSASEAEGGETDNDSEAETEIFGGEDEDQIAESQASRAAGLMLRTSQEMAKGSVISGRGMKQTKLFGAVQKANVERVVAGADGPPAKRQRTNESEVGRVGLGISGVRD